MVDGVVLAEPLLKWAGGKRKLADAIDNLFGGSAGLPAAYVEPFAGSLAVFFHRWNLGRFRECEKVILGDTCGPLMNFYRFVRNDWDGLVTEIVGLPRAEGAWSGAYYSLRDEFNTTDGDRLTLRRAALTWWLNKACFNGLWRTNGDGKFNVPAGDRKEIPAPEPRAFQVAAKALADVELLTADALQVLTRPLPANTQVYLDPPYWPVNEESFTDYSDRFVGTHHLALVGAAKRIASAGGKVVLSNADVPAMRALLGEVGGCDVSEVPVRRSVGASVETRKVVQELLVRFG